MVCIGIGGSYLGAKAVNSALADNFEYYYAPNPGNPKVVYAGQNIGEDYIADLERLLSGKRFGIIVISKSGTTTEPAISFRIFKEMLEKQAGVEAPANSSWQLPTRRRELSVLLPTVRATRRM